MPTDKQTKSNTSKPLTPALSSNFRNVKTPLTPRVLGSTHSSPSLSTRREPFVRAKSPGKTDQVTTPLNGNITPRSGARLSRIGTESPSTPAPVRGPNHGAPSNEGAPKEAVKPGAGQAKALGPITPRVAADTGTPVVTVHRRVSGAKSMVESGKAISEKFFHANDAKSVVGSPTLDEGHRFPPGRSQFFVGSPTLPSAASSQTSGGPLSAREPVRDEKFFRADDIPQHAPTKRPTTLPQISTAPAVDTARLSNGQSHATNSRPVQSSPPNSPDRPRRPLAATPRSPRKVPPALKASPPAPPRSTTDRPKSATGSIVSASPSHQGGHRKSISSGSLTAGPVKTMSGQQAQRPQALDLRLAQPGSSRTTGTNLLSADMSSPRSASLASTNTFSASNTSETDCSEATNSMIAAVNSSDAATDQGITPNPQNEEAANARRERKVLDLEISNSSLLAINKTLERELRKQSGELRRFRRLSRSGRLSLASTTRTVSGQSGYSLDTVAELDGEDQALSDLEAESDLDDLDDEDDSLVSNDSSYLASPTSRARQRARDERRLLLDLSKHQQLLVDSQKLSQSIKRCLTRTEELIRDGNRALDYRVGIGDIKLGGRVLHDDELDERGLDNGIEEQDGGQGLLSPGLAKTRIDEAQLWIDDSTSSTGQPTALALLQEITDRLESGATDTQAI